RAVLGADEIPPVDLFIFVEASFLARGDDPPDAAGEMLDIGIRDVVARRDRPQESPERYGKLVNVGRKARRQLDSRLVIARDQNLRRVDEIAEDRSLAKGDARQRVGDVAVEVREEAEAVLS